MTDWNQVWSFVWPAFPAVAACYRWWSVRQRHIHGPVNPKIERPTRKMLGHAIREEMVELNMLVQAAGEEVFRGCIALCAVACGYISIDVSGCWWPSEADRREIARIAATKAITHFDLAESDVYEYVSRVALGGERPHEVFPAGTAVMLPLLITANMLLVFCPEDKDWWRYLDQIWDDTEAAEDARRSVFIALMLRKSKEDRAKANGAAGG